MANTRKSSTTAKTAKASSTTGKSKCGKKLKYTTAEEMQQVIDEYFDGCKGNLLYLPNGKPCLDKFGYPIYDGKRQPTMSGLAFALGFSSRQSILNYQNRPEFEEVIKRAKLRLEMYTEERLFDKDGSNGAKFSLMNNFPNWNEASTKEAAAIAAAAAVKIICDIPSTPTAVLAAAEIQQPKISQEDDKQ